MAVEPGWARVKARPEREGGTAANPALAALLDHLAAELAREYIRLMEDTVRTHPIQPSATESEEG
jgi:hypothetical protein